jgi:hypothetical protein
MAKSKKAGAAETKASFDASVLATSAEGARQAVIEAGARAADLVDAWVSSKNAAAVAALAEDEGAPAPARKAARRGINVLKARGVAIPERTRVGRLASEEKTAIEAWIISPDATGASVVLVSSRAATGRFRVVQAVLRREVGLLEVRAFDLSGSQFKGYFEETMKRLGHGPTPVPLAWARARVAAARQDNQKSGAILPMGLDSHADLLGPAPAKAPPHPIDEAKLELPQGAEAAARSATLHAEPEFRSWLPGGDSVRELLVGIGERISKEGPPDQAGKERVDAAIGEALDAATDRFFTPELRKEMAVNMKDAAISVLARAGRERAADVLAAAAAIEAAGLITSPPHEVPFLRGFFQKALAVLAAQSGGQLSIPVVQPPEGPAIVSPAELAAEVAQPGEKVSPGGIILP